MSDELALVDTNVLVYAVQQDSEHHAAARGLLDQALDGEIGLCVTSQVLAEFYAVVTDSRRVTNPRKPQEVLEAIDQILAVPGITLLPAPPDLVDRWTALARRYCTTCGAIFDTLLAATILGNGISAIYTFDRSHFERFDGLRVLPIGKPMSK